MTAKLLVLAGPPCSGKSTLAVSIQARSGFHWLEVDRILSKLIPDSQRGKSDRNLAYRAAHMLAEEMLRCGRPVMLDATYGSSEHRKSVELLMTVLTVPLYLIEFNISPDTAVARFKGRSDHPAVDLTEERVRRIAERYFYSDQGLTVMTEMTPEDALQRAADYLRQARSLDVDSSWSASSIGYSVE
jgi:predicted kinase